MMAANIDGVVLRGYLLYTKAGKAKNQYKFVIPSDLEDPRRTAFKLGALHRLYPGRSPVVGNDFYVNPTDAVDIEMGGEQVYARAMEGALVDVWARVRRYKYYSEGITKIGWALDAVRMRCDFDADSGG